MKNTLKISEAASLALHAMGLMASLPEKLFSTKEIAQTLKASEAHLSKVLQRLTAAGLVKPVRGPRGGYSLARKGDRITLLEVYEAIEGKFRASSCLLGEKVCPGKDCVMGDFLREMNARFTRYMDNTKISGLARVYEGGKNA